MGIKTYISRALKYIVKGTPIKKTTAEISYLQPNGRLVGKRIIITGGGRGIGASMAKAPENQDLKFMTVDDVKRLYK